MEFITNNWETIVTSAVSICAAVAALLPTPQPESSVVYRAIHGLINKVGLNIWNAKNLK